MKPIAATLAAVLVAGALAAPAAAQSASSAMPSCAAGDPVVWVNTSTKVYHVSGDAYFGKTRHGMYACRSVALQRGAHASKGAMHGKKGCHPSGMSGDAMSADGDTAMKKKHHHRTSGDTMASPAPAATM